MHGKIQIECSAHTHTLSLTANAAGSWNSAWDVAFKTKEEEQFWLVILTIAITITLTATTNWRRNKSTTSCVRSIICTSLLKLSTDSKRRETTTTTTTIGSFEHCVTCDTICHTVMSHPSAWWERGKKVLLLSPPFWIPKNYCITPAALY